VICYAHESLPRKTLWCYQQTLPQNYQQSQVQMQPYGPAPSQQQSQNRRAEISKAPEFGAVHLIVLLGSRAMRSHDDLQAMAQKSVAPQQHSVSALLPPRGRREGGGQRGRAGQASQGHQVTFTAPAQAATEPPKWAAMTGGNSTNPQLCMNPACVRGAVCWKNHVAK